MPTAALLVVVVVLGGCQQSSRTGSLSVAPMNTRQPTLLTAYDVALAMRQAGFSDEQILALGTDVRNAVAGSGGAHVRVGNATEALMAVEGHHLYVTSRRGMTRTYDLLHDDTRGGASAADDRSPSGVLGGPATP